VPFLPEPSARRRRHLHQVRLQSSDEKANRGWTGSFRWARRWLRAGIALVQTPWPYVGVLVFVLGGLYYGGRTNPPMMLAFVLIWPFTAWWCTFWS